MVLDRFTIEFTCIKINACLYEVFLCIIIEWNVTIKHLQNNSMFSVTLKILLHY